MTRRLTCRRVDHVAEVKLINSLQLPAEDVHAVVARAKLPPGTLVIILDDSLLQPTFQAVTIPRAHIRFADNLAGLENTLQEPWDCGISIGPFWSRRQGEFPAYFAYLLGHELGHAKTVLTSLELTSFEDLITRCIRHVSHGHYSRWDDLPHEILYDQFGISIAQQLYGREILETEFATIIDRELVDVPRLRKILSLEPSDDLSGLKEALAAFAAPYRDELLGVWREMKASHSPGATRLIDNLERLWEPNSA